MNMTIIQELCNQKKMRWTNHIFVRLIQRNISIPDVENVIRTGEVIENYPNDDPYPSCLILGNTRNGKFIHVVCGLGEDEIWLITAYYPDIMKWSEDFRTRKES